MTWKAIAEKHNVNRVTASRFCHALNDLRIIHIAAWVKTGEAALRCAWTVKLADGSEAQCGRRKTQGALCTQHHKMREAMEFPCCSGTDEHPPQHTQDCTYQPQGDSTYD